MVLKISNQFEKFKLILKKFKPNIKFEPQHNYVVFSDAIKQNSVSKY